MKANYSFFGAATIKPNSVGRTATVLFSETVTLWSGPNVSSTVMKCTQFCTYSVLENDIWERDSDLKLWRSEISGTSELGLVILQRFLH